MLPINRSWCIEQLVHAIDRDLPVQAVAPLDELLSRSVAEPRFRTSLLITFAALGLLLACVGIYGIVAYDVATRTREIGIRVALGARPNAVIGTVMARSLALVGAGLLVGLAGSLLFNQKTARHIFNFLNKGGIVPDRATSYIDLSDVDLREGFDYRARILATPDGANAFDPRYGQQDLFEPGVRGYFTVKFLF